MAILGLQGVRGGTGTTSITAALAWALQLLGETVLVVDDTKENLTVIGELLNPHYNVRIANSGQRASNSCVGR